jgi:hypothetical protein
MKVKCGDCGKIVRDKPLIGTLHVCLLPEEIAARKSAMAQLEMQRRAVEGVPSHANPNSLFYLGWV